MTTYPFWIEHDENNNPQNYVWVKVDSIPASSTKTIYAIKESGYSPNGDNVFEFFDDFEGTSLNTSKWNEENTGGNLTIENSQLKISMSASTSGKIRSIYSIETFSSGYIFETRVSVDTVSLPYNSMGFGTRWKGFSTTTPTGGLCFGDYTNGNNYLGAYYGEPESYGTVEFLSQYDGFHKYSIEYDSTDNVIYTVDGSVVYTKTNTDSFQTTNHITFASNSHPSFSYSENDELIVEWVFVRKYVTNKPTITVTDMGTYYKIDITNNEVSTLTGYQVAIPINELDITSTDESIKFTDTSPEQPSEVVNKALHFSHNF